MIVGNDISTFQGNIDFNTYKNNSNFIFIKATEGNGFTDPKFNFNRSEARRVELPRGYYHFARPDLGNAAEDEARWFLSQLATDPLQEGEVLALDYEVNFRDPVGWCKTFLDYIFTETKCKPLIYLNQSTIKSYDWKPIASNDYGLWVADYTYDPNSIDINIGAWKFLACQQWTDKQQVSGISGIVDGDVFFGDSHIFQAYGFHLPDPCANYKEQLTGLQQQFDAYKKANPEKATIDIPNLLNTPVLTETDKSFFINFFKKIGILK